jgi:hypothetical protein
MEAIEGKRAEQRNKPPFPVTDGVVKKLTGLNKIETFAHPEFAVCVPASATLGQSRQSPRAFEKNCGRRQGPYNCSVPIVISRWDLAWPAGLHEASGLREALLAVPRCSSTGGAASRCRTKS